MTLPASIPKAILLGNGSTTLLPMDFQFPTNDDIQVTRLTISTGIEDVITVGFVITGAGEDDGGEVTFDVAPTNDQKMIAERIVDLSQGANYKNNEGFPSEEHETQMDRTVMMSQQISSELDRGIRMQTSVDFTSFSAEIRGTPFANKSVIVDPTGQFMKFSIQDADSASADNAAASAVLAATSETNAAASAAAALVSEQAADVSAISIQNFLDVVARNVAWEHISDEVVRIAAGTKFKGTDTGAGFTFVTTRDFDITGTPGDLGAINTGTAAVSTYYYLIALGDTTGAVDPHIIGVTEANYATFTTADLTGNYAVYDDFKRIGVTRTAGGIADFSTLRGRYSDDKFIYDGPEDLGAAQKGTSSSTFTDIDYSGVAPLITRELIINFSTGTVGSSFWRVNGSSAVSGTACAGAIDAINTQLIICDAAQIFEVKTSSTAPALNMVLSGYVDNLEREK